MRTQAAWAIGVGIIGGLSSFSDASAQTLPISWSNPPTQPVPGVSHRTFLSRAAGVQVGYSIVLPPQYESSGSQRYPVLYWLHGAGGNESGSQTSTVAGVALRAMSSGQLPEFIIVFVNAGAETFFADSPDGRIPSETAFIRELIPHVDATYRTRSERAGRAIEGFSMGGFGALSLSFKYPDLFNSVVAYAPALVEVQPEADGTLTLSRVGGTHPGGSQRSSEARAVTLLTFREGFGGDPELFARHSPFTILSRGRRRAFAKSCRCRDRDCRRPP
jgi:S-formylglutathione hydrolase FrmB